MKKDYIHSVDSTLLLVYEEFGDVTEAAVQSREYLKTVLNKYGIHYEDLRQVLNPGNSSFAYIFNSDKFEVQYDYFSPLINIMLSCIEDKARCVFLAGDITSENITDDVYKELFVENGQDVSLLYRHNLSCVVIEKISEKTNDEIIAKLCDTTSFLFSVNITKPTITKRALTYCLPQTFIKYETKIIYSVPEESDTSNYSSVKNPKYRLCPIPEDLYLTFLQSRSLQIHAPFQELVYAVRACYDFAIEGYPKVVVSDDKYAYITCGKKIHVEKNELVRLIDGAIKSNQIHHIAKTGYDEDYCIDMNVIVYISDHQYTVGVKWNLKDNIVTLITMV